MTQLREIGPELWACERPFSTLGVQSSLRHDDDPRSARLQGRRQ